MIRILKKVALLSAFITILLSGAGTVSASVVTGTLRSSTETNQTGGNGHSISGTVSGGSNPSEESASGSGSIGIVPAPGNTENGNAGGSTQEQFTPVNSSLREDAESANVADFSNIAFGNSDRAQNQISSGNASLTDGTEAPDARSIALNTQKPPVQNLGLAAAGETGFSFGWAWWLLAIALVGGIGYAFWRYRNPT